MPRVVLSNKTFLQAMQSPTVRAALREKAHQVANAVDAAAAREGVDMGTVVTEGTRPKGRPYARVSVDLEAEWGSMAAPKRRILGRVAGAYNAPR